MSSRRSFIRNSAGILIAAPMVARAGLLMPVVPYSGPYRVPIEDYERAFGNSMVVMRARQCGKTHLTQALAKYYAEQMKESIEAGFFIPVPRKRTDQAVDEILRRL